MNRIFAGVCNWVRNLKPVTRSFVTGFVTGFNSQTSYKIAPEMAYPLSEHACFLHIVQQEGLCVTYVTGFFKRNPIKRFRQKKIFLRLFQAFLGEKIFIFFTKKKVMVPLEITSYTSYTSYKEI